MPPGPQRRWSYPTTTRSVSAGLEFGDYFALHNICKKTKRLENNKDIQEGLSVVCSPPSELRSRATSPRETSKRRSVTPSSRPHPSVGNVSPLGLALSGRKSNFIAKQRSTTPPRSVSPGARVRCITGPPRRNELNKNTKFAPISRRQRSVTPPAGMKNGPSTAKRSPVTRRSVTPPHQFRSNKKVRNFSTGRKQRSGTPPPSTRQRSVTPPPSTRQRLKSPIRKHANAAPVRKQTPVPISSPPGGPIRPKRVPAVNQNGIGIVSPVGFRRLSSAPVRSVGVGVGVRGGPVREVTNPRQASPARIDRPRTGLRCSPSPNLRNTNRRTESNSLEDIIVGVCDPIEILQPDRLLQSANRQSLFDTIPAEAPERYITPDAVREVADRTFRNSSANTIPLEINERSLTDTVPLEECEQVSASNMSGDVIRTQLSETLPPSRCGQPKDYFILISSCTDNPIPDFDCLNKTDKSDDDEGSLQSGNELLETCSPSVGLDRSGFNPSNHLSRNSSLDNCCHISQQEHSDIDCISQNLTSLKNKIPQPPERDISPKLLNYRPTAVVRIPQLSIISTESVIKNPQLPHQRVNLVTKEGHPMQSKSHSQQLVRRNNSGNYIQLKSSSRYQTSNYQLLQQERKARFAALSKRIDELLLKVQKLRLNDNEGCVPTSMKVRPTVVSKQSIQSLERERIREDTINNATDVVVEHQLTLCTDRTIAVSEKTSETTAVLTTDSSEIIIPTKQLTIPTSTTPVIKKSTTDINNTSLVASYLLEFNIKTKTDIISDNDLDMSTSESDYTVLIENNNNLIDLFSTSDAVLVSETQCDDLMVSGCWDSKGGQSFSSSHIDQTTHDSNSETDDIVVDIDLPSLIGSTIDTTTTTTAVLSSGSEELPTLLLVSSQSVYNDRHVNSSNVTDGGELG